LSVERQDTAPVRVGISLQSRITVVAMITAVAVLLAACAAFIAEQWRTARTDHLEQQTVVTAVFAAGSSVVSSYRDPARAQANIDHVRGMYPGFAAAYLLDARGAVMAGFGPPDPAAAAMDQNEARAVVRLDGRPVGTLVTYTDPTPVWGTLPRYLALTTALFFAAMGLALFLGRWLAGRVTEPVDRLSRTMRAVTEGADFAQRVERTDDDELGRLTDSFNDLLARLHHNDQALRASLAELVDARDSAEQANRSKSQFLANMSHEIRTPLNGLLAMAQVMALEALDPVQRGRLEVIRQSGEALLAILNDVLDVSKIEAGKLELEVDAFDPEVVFRGAAAAFAALAEKKGLELTLEMRPEARGRRQGDAARLRQIFDNLVANALKFTPEGQVTATVEGLGPGGADGLRLIVADSGIGIAPEAIPHLFQKFTQADSSTTRRFGGTGLGLAICQELAELMGGRIALESTPGVGSTFTVELPLSRVAAPAPAPAPVAPSLAEASARPLRVLAAEDNPTNQLVLTTVMGIFGVELTLVANGREAVDAWRAGEFDLILMDIQMPEMDGRAAAQAIRAAEAGAGRARIPIIALSAHAMTHQVSDYLKAGFDLHVAKPIELPKLQAAMAEAVALGAEAAPVRAAVV
jgi:signal transduction histidine kinase/AmiR/NasT family two-component response regulator